MSDIETDDRCVSHDLHQNRPTEGTFDTGKPVRRTRTKPFRHQDTDKNKEKSKMISVILIDKLKSSTDNLLGTVLSGHAQRREDSPSSPLPIDNDESKLKRYVTVRGGTDDETARRHSHFRSKCPWAVFERPMRMVVPLTMMWCQCRQKRSHEQMTDPMAVTRPREDALLLNQILWCLIVCTLTV